MITKIKSSIIFSAIILTTGWCQQEFEKTGTSGAHFLNISPDAKVSGMGNSVVGMPIHDVSAVFYNPGSLVHMQRTSIFTSNVQWFADINYNAFAIGRKTKYGTLVLHLRSLSSGEIEETTVVEQNGTGRTFVWNDLAVGGAWAKALTDRFSFGMNLYRVTQSIDLYSYTASVWVVDIGTYYVTGFRSLILGMSVRNFAPELNFMVNGKDATFDDYHNGETLPEPKTFRPYHMPLTFQVGVSYDFFTENKIHDLIVAVDGVHTSDSAERLNIGAQYAFMNILYLRGGLYTNHNSASIMGGIGLDLSKFMPFGTSLRFDTSMSNYGLLGFVKKITVSVGF
jgi:hypothetical protein